MSFLCINCHPNGNTILKRINNLDNSVQERIMKNPESYPKDCDSCNTIKNRLWFFIKTRTEEE